MKYFKYRLWAGLGTALILYCLPVGIYTCLQGMKIFRLLKIGDTSTADKCVKHIKISIISVIAFYVLIVIIALNVD